MSLVTIRIVLYAKKWEFYMKLLRFLLLFSIAISFQGSLVTKAPKQTASLQTKELKQTDSLDKTEHKQPVRPTQSNEAAYLKIIEHKQQNRHIIGVRDFGFFSNFFLVLAHLNWCLKHKKIPVIHWDHEFPYYQPEGYNGSKNAWEYYFKPISNRSYHVGDIIDRRYNAPDRSYIIWWDYPRMLKYREFFNKLIKKYIHNKESILKKVESFYDKHMKGKKTIGMHIRGTDKHIEAPSVSISKFIKQAKTYPKEYQFYVATDEYKLLDTIKKELKGYTIIHYDAHRSDDKEPIHYKKAPNKALLGEEILIETLLLSRCDKFIHAHSNVALAALYFNATLESILLTP